VVAVLVVAAITPLPAITLSIGPADIERALVVARDQDRTRERFHAAYIVTVDDPFVQSLEIISEYRRIVLLAEERMSKGDRAFSYSSRLAGEALTPWRNRVAVRARLRFHPHNAYVVVPKIEMSVDGPNADLALIGVTSEPVYGFAERGKQAPIAAAIADGVFEAKLIGQTKRTVTVKMDGKVLIARQLDFGSVE
jgi:hypothetical protein